jgi:hypothetical protein
MPAWVTGLAFVSANLGATEVIGQAANGAEYGTMTVHYYWVGANPARSGLLVGWFRARRRATSPPAGGRICRIAGGAVACWYRMVLDSVSDYRFVKVYPAKTGVKSSQSGNSSH